MASANPKNKSLNSPFDNSGTTPGSGVMVGDGVMLTAGHVVWEFNGKSNVSQRDIRALSGSTSFWDPREYFGQLSSLVANLGSGFIN